MEVISQVVGILVLVLANAFFVAAEFAIVRARRPRLEAMAREGDRLATMALRASNATGKILAASELGITLASLGLGWILATWFADYAPGGSSRRTVALFLLAALVVVFLHIIFGELTPRAVAV